MSLDHLNKIYQENYGFYLMLYILYPMEKYKAILYKFKEKGKKIQLNKIYQEN